MRARGVSSKQLRSQNEAIYVFVSGLAYRFRRNDSHETEPMLGACRFFHGYGLTEGSPPLPLLINS
jgi:hypothetical protein